MNELEKGLIIFTFDKEREEFQEIDCDTNKINEVLKSDQINIIVNRHVKEIWIWNGSNAKVRMKFIATQEAPKIRDRYAIDYNIHTIDEGSETHLFKETFELE